MQKWMALCVSLLNSILGSKYNLANFMFNSSFYLFALSMMLYEMAGTAHRNPHIDEQNITSNNIKLNLKIVNVVASLRSSSIMQLTMA